MHELMITLWIWVIGGLTITGLYCHAQRYEDVTLADLFVGFFLWPLVLAIMISNLWKR